MFGSSDHFKDTLNVHFQNYIFVIDTYIMKKEYAYLFPNKETCKFVKMLYK